MRKVLSFVLVLALVLGSFSMAFAATPTDVVGTDYSEAVTVLSGLGVVAGYPDGTYKPAQAVTRAEMAKLIVVALGLEDYAIGTSKFPDMAGATWAQGYVNYASGLGVILGYPDGTFKPSQTVSYDEAAAMIVRALGYTDASLLPATWPANYVVKAKALGVLADITAKAGGADRGDVAIMLYNALSLNIGSIDNDSGKWVANATVAPFDRMITRLGAESDTFTVAPGDVGDEDVTLVDLSDYVYATLNVYTIDGVIVSIASVDSDSATGELTTATAIVTLANDDDISIAAVTTQTAVYFNGGETTYGAVDSEFLDSYDVTVYGTLNAAETSFSTIAGIVAWAPTSVELVTEDDVTDISDAIIDGDGTVLGVDLSTVDGDGLALDLAKITVVGAATKLADIKADDVVYVYASANDYSLAKVKFEVVRNAKDITVTKLTSTKVYAGATAYELATFNFTDATVSVIGDFAVADDYTLYLGNDGKIVFEDLTATTPDNYGVVTATYMAVGIDTTYQIKILTADNDFVVFTADTDLLTVPEINTITTGRAIAYATDSDGLLTDVTTSTAVTLTGQTYNSRTNALAAKFLASNVVVFDATTTAAVTDWEVSSLTDGQTVYGSYILNDDGEIAAVAYSLATGGTADTNYFAVNAIGSVQNASEDLVLELTGFKGAVVNTSLSTSAYYNASYLDDAPVVWAVTYSGIEVSAVGVPSYTTTAAVVVDASDVMVEVSGTIYEVAADVVVYVSVYDADGVLDSYTVGDMGDVTAGDKLALKWNSDSEVDLIVLTQRADVANYTL
jgi:hypothetical protein